MSDDEETLVRQRLFRLLDGRTGAVGGLPVDNASAAGPARIPRSAGSDNGPGVAPAMPEEPRRLAGPGAFDPGRRGIRALAVVAALVVLAAAGWAWLSRPRTESVASPPPPSAPALAPAPAGSGGTETGAAEVVVAVAGKVRRPGLVRLPAGARVADALQSAGGPLPGVDVALLNLARKVTDGELILVGVTPPPGAGPADADPAAAGGARPGGGKVNLNTASVAQLDALPGVGPVLAQRIVAHREEHGGFRSVADLRQVTGIGDARYEDLKDLVTV
ncbi:helix-hairpin-helix domain-containing protein [Plantactinospora sp. WMMC1484]|uniref:helix-hairpin-helix domain-containing protein n=1 Tax=Plantactinospora sp. WMMC1484 TaxID=3404122 RepID=UPI003BF4DA28